MVRFLLANKTLLPAGWAARLLVQCGIQFGEIWDVFHEMYESQVTQKSLSWVNKPYYCTRFLRSTTKPMFKRFRQKLLSSLPTGSRKQLGRKQRPLEWSFLSPAWILPLTTTFPSWAQIVRKQEPCMKMQNASCASIGDIFGVSFVSNEASMCFE